MTEPSHDVLVETLKVAVPLHIAELRGYPPAHPMGALEAWLQDGDPLDEAPEIEMGVWLSPEQTDELDCLAAELWPQNEYFAIADLYVRGES